jgi:hypothetical protein
VTKEDEPNMELIEVDQIYLDEAMKIVKADQGVIRDIKQGLLNPERCGQCGCCRKNKVLLEPIKLSMLANRK